MDDMNRENQGEGEGLIDKAKQAIGGLFGGGETDTAPSDVRDMSGTAATDSYAIGTGVGTSGGGMGGYGETADFGTSDVTGSVGASDVGVGGDFGRGTGGTSAYAGDTGTVDNFGTSGSETINSNDYSTGASADMGTSDYDTEVETRSLHPTEFGTSGGSADIGAFGTDTEAGGDVDTRNLTQGVGSERDDSRGRF